MYFTKHKRIKMTRLIVCFIAVCFSFSLLAQDFAQRGITANEKKALEEQFQDLKTFYIADDGTVVFQQNIEENNVEKRIVDTENNTTSAPRIKIKVAVNEFGEYTVTEEESVIEEVEGRGLPTEASYEERDTNIPNTPIMLKENNEPIKQVIDQPVAISEKHEEVITTNNTGKKEVFKKRVSSYKSLEEAALDVDQLLEKYKRQQEQSKKGSSLSQKISGGVNGSLRNRNFDSFESDDEEITEEPESNNPTYYINGVISTKKDVDKLKTRDILKKVVKRSSTNPNGEWWIETRQK